MPSPFPGMDPYLEEPTLWSDVHGRLINAASELLLAQLRPKYFVQIDERLYLANDNDEARDLIIPDLRIREVGFGAASGTSGGAALAISPGLQLAYGFEFDVRESYLQVLDRASQRVVTVVEILSPANKVNGSAAHRSYDAKKRDVLAGYTNLVEIDLLREGVPLASRWDFPAHEYMAQVWRFSEKEPGRTVWPMSLSEPLKRIPVPVRPEDPDAILNLQAMLDTAYDRAGYELRVDYRKEPIPPLRGEAAEWAGRVLKDRGVRGSS
jgi:hypothetical protein